MAQETEADIELEHLLEPAKNDAISESGDEDFHEDQDSYAQDPFRPFDGLPDEPGNILTVRAVVLGLVCGTLVNASNVYLGLKAGWTASANLFGSIIGFTVLKSCSKYATSIPLLRGKFGPRENNIVQTTATASGGMANVFVSAFPAMYQLGLLSRDPSQDVWRLITVTAAGGYFGLFFSSPLRSFFIVHVARELQLVFPSSTATAITIKSMHMGLEGGSSHRAARNKVRALAIAFAFAASLRVVSQYALGIIWDWHPFTWLYLLTHSSGALAAESWGWFIEWSPAFIGSGMLVGANVAVSFFAGSILAWALIGPYLVFNGMAFGTAAVGDNNSTLWSGYQSFNSLSEDFTTIDHPSPRYWLLWPGIACMVTAALLDLLCQWRVFFLGGRALWTAVRSRFSSRDRQARPSDEPSSTAIEDPADPADQVPLWLWASGLVCVLAITCGVASLQFNMSIPFTLLALFLSLFFSFLAVQATGTTDITPLSGASMTTQLILGNTTRSIPVQAAQRMNLLGGALTSLGASQAADLAGDFRVGFLLRTSPKMQWYAQAIGTAAAVFFAPAIYVLFATAYPCINDAAAPSCTFAAPSVSAWRAIAVAVTEPELPVPTSSRGFAVGAAIFGGASVLVRQFLWTGKWAGMRKWHPNMMSLSLAFIFPTTVFGTAMVMGAIGAAVWKRANGKGFDTYAYAVAAGFMAGEGIGGIVNAVLEILGLSGAVFGSQAGCPAWKC